MGIYFGSDELGQSTVEYAVVGFALLAIMIALGALWRFGSDGGFQEALQAHTSHAIGSEGGIVDVLLY